jgi:hypothetical protein
LTAFGSEIVLGAGGYHSHFDNSPDPPKLVTAALGIARDLLSPSMRLREWRSNGSPYRWALESRLGNTWTTDGTTGLLFWNYFGKRTEQTFQNRQLPSREQREPE